MPETKKETTQKNNTTSSVKKSPKTTKKTEAKVTSDKKTAKTTKTKVNSAKKAETKNTTTKKKTNSNTTNAKNASAIVATKKTSTKKKAASKKHEIIEYYDLPYRYNQTIVKILAQTPNTLFVYWDISEEDRKKYIQEFGENFFETSKPVLIIHNKTKNYSFEVEINDFANSWYLNSTDADCEYEIELGRKSLSISLPNNYLPIVSSNKIETPNNHILFEKVQNTVFFRNVKTNQVASKDVANLQFIRRIGKIYNIYDVYKKIYKNEELQKIDNPTSNFNIE